MILQTFRHTLPNVHKHLMRRAYFCDYLLQTGIFTNVELDQQHRQLYDRIMQHYLHRYQNREIFGRRSEQDKDTERSAGPISEDLNPELLSVTAARDGKIVQAYESYYNPAHLCPLGLLVAARPGTRREG